MAKKPKKQKAAKEKMTFSKQVISWTKTIIGAIIVVMILNGAAIASFVVPTGSMENTVMTGDFLFVNKFVYGPSTPQVIPFFNIPLPFYKFPGIKDPEKGDVIVFIFPGNRDEVEPDDFQYYLKRCVATAGDTLQIINDKLYVNGKLQPLPEHGKFDNTEIVHPSEKYRTFPPGKGWTRENFGPLRIPMEGDVIKLTPKNLQDWAVFIKREGHDVYSDGRAVFLDGVATDSYTVERNYCFGIGDNRDHSLDSRYWGFIPYENVVGTPIVVYWSWNTNEPMSEIGKKLKSVRWSRLGTLIN